MVKKNNKWWVSSTGNGVSLTLKGLIVALVPIFVAISRHYGVEVTENEIIEIIESVSVTVSTVMILFGLIRKLAIKLKLLQQSIKTLLGSLLLAFVAIGVPASADAPIEQPVIESQSQSFVEAIAVPYVRPIPSVVVGRNFGRIHVNNGVDIANRCGTPIYSYAEGIVRIADAEGYNGGWGKYVVIGHPNGTETLYAHLSVVSVIKGSYYPRGYNIGLMGTTGRSTGCHLHFEVHGARNPYAY